MKLITKDILTVDNGIICQQVNCQGVMGKGIALKIRNKWPEVYNDYIRYCSFKKHDFELLGDYIITEISQDIDVISIFGQLYYGYNARFTDYCALNEAFYSIKQISSKDIYFPERMGCVNGGGDWAVVSKMIEYYFPNAIICQL